MKLQVLSDLHLGVAGFEVQPTDADVIVLAGDIARPQPAVDFACALGKPVVLVAGNHEFYGGSLDGTLAELRARCRGTPVHFLSGDSCTIGGVRFVGATLWSDLRLAGEGAARDEAVAMALRLVRDFSRIRRSADAEALFTPDDSAALFDAQSAWLRERLAEPADGPTVVVTHHAPSPRSIHPRFAGSPINGCFVSDLEPLFGGDRVALWIHGHTHDSFDYTVAGTRVVCNPRGYVVDGRRENAAFDPGLVVEVG